MKIIQNGNTKLIQRKKPKNLRTQYQKLHETKFRKSQKNNKNQNDEIEVIRYNKQKKPINEKPKINIPSCPSCEQNIWLEIY